MTMIDDAGAGSRSLLPSFPVEEKAAFLGDNGDFLCLVTIGALLELITVGFYRFWLATNIRRHLWSNTTFGGDALEYLGTGRELLFGFFFALAILAPAYLAYFLVGVEAEAYKAFASIPLGVFLMVFGNYAIYRARRYRLHRTAWRGLRFGMKGSAWGYAGLALLWGAAAGATLGLAGPWAEAALERHKMRNTFYGALDGGFVGSGATLFKRGWWIWLLGVVAVAALIATAPKNAEGHEEAAGLWFGFLVLIGISTIFLYGAYKAIQWKWWLEGVRIGDVRATSNLKMGAFINNYWKFVGVFLSLTIAFAILVGLGFAGLAAAGLLQTKQGAPPPISFFIAFGAVYYAFLLSLGVLWRIYFVQRVWKLVMNSLTLHNLDQARDVRARESSASAIGEGFADSLDIVGF
jgi:uncharacterized membrane protein YjgN (DUF898 family)